MKRVKSKAGFTMIEILVSIALFAMVSLTIFVTISASKLIENKNKQKGEAISIKSGVADQIKASQNAWKTLDGLKIWLGQNGYTAEDDLQTTYSATIISNDIEYEVMLYVNSTTVTKLFEVRISVDSPMNEPTILVTRYYG